MATRRTIRVAEVIRKELSRLMQRTVELEGLMVTISAIDPSPDLRHADVFVSVLNPEIDGDHAIKLLNVHRRQWTHDVGKSLATKITPQLHFRFDRGMERGDRVMEILTGLNIPEPVKSEHDDDGDDERAPNDDLPMEDDEGQDAGDEEPGDDEDEQEKAPREQLKSRRRR